MVIKHQRQLETSTMPLAQELLTNIQCSDASRSFAKETRTLKMNSVVVSQLRAVTEAALLELYKK